MNDHVWLLSRNVMELPHILTTDDKDVQKLRKFVTFIIVDDTFEIQVILMANIRLRCKYI